MATPKEHEEQWRRNHDFLAKLVKENQQPDWIVTIAFYTALHSVNRYMAYRDEHPAKHDLLMILMKGRFLTKFDTIFLDYKNMQRLSESARYLCHTPTPNEIQLQLDRLKKIDEHINFILPIHLRPKP